MVSILYKYHISQAQTSEYGDNTFQSVDPL